MSDWNPELYLKFKNERTQPAHDLISRIDMRYPQRILDIGCGPGNSSHLLKGRWFSAEVLGLDSSEAMIERAIKEHRNVNFVLADATGDISRFGMFDIVFSNAAMQWMPSIEKLLPFYFKMLNPGGIMAMQIPNPSSMHIQTAIDRVASSDRWKNYFLQFQNGLYLYEPGFYYDILRSLSKEANVWETHYHHVMPGHQAIIDWYASTGMKPYLSLLSDDDKQAFSDDVLFIIKNDYKIQKNGSVLFPFRRIFFTLQKL